MTPGMRGRLWARSLLLQSCWNVERMQNLGLMYGLEPWLERLYPDAGRRTEAYLRHHDYFNTNPYMEPLVVGMVCGLEEEAAAAPQEQRPQLYARLLALKKGASAPLAGLGDTLFWQTLRPFSAAAALAAGALLWKLGAPGALALMALCYLAVFNIPAQWLRYRGFAQGYQWRGEIAAKLKSFPWQAAIKKLRVLGTALAAGLLLCALVFAGSPAERGLGVLALLLCLLADRVVLRPVSPVRLYAGASCLGVLAAAAGWI